MIKTFFLNSQKLPFVVKAESDAAGLPALCDFAISNRDFLRAELLKYGALLFRGFRIERAEEFREFVRKFSGREFFSYAGGASPRFALRKNLYNSTEYPSDLRLELHNELSYSENYPRHLYFFCQTAPEAGGATTLGDSRRIRRRIDAEIARLFKEKQVLYERRLGSEKGAGYSWQEAFETIDPQTVEDVCRRTNIDFEWLPEDRLKLRQIRPATLVHPDTGDEVWFNQAHGFHWSALDGETLAAVRAAGEDLRLNSYFGDGSPICPLALEHVRGVLQAETLPHRWQAGDILMLDNILTAHGRMPFSGARKIVLAMT